MEKIIDKKTGVAIAVILVVIAGLVWLAMFWQFGKIKTLADDIQKEQLDSFVREERSKKILELGRELGDVARRGADMRLMLIEKENAVPFLKALEVIAAETGNSIAIGVVDLSKIKSLTQKKPAVSETEIESKKDIQKEEQAKKTTQSAGQKQDFSNQLGFSLEITGRYRNFVDFLTKLENLPYFVRIYSFDMNPAAKNQTGQPAGSAPVPPEDEKNIKSTIIIGVYVNGTK